MLKMGLRDDFGYNNGWGMSFMNRFGMKTSENGGFLGEKE